MPLSRHKKVPSYAFPLEVLKILGNAARVETIPVANGEYANILKNITVAEEWVVPLCQTPRSGPIS